MDFELPREVSFSFLHTNIANVQIFSNLSFIIPLLSFYVLYLACYYLVSYIFLYINLLGTVVTHDSDHRWSSFCYWPESVEVTSMEIGVVHYSVEFYCDEDLRLTSISSFVPSSFVFSSSSGLNCRSAFLFFFLFFSSHN